MPHRISCALADKLVSAARTDATSREPYIRHDTKRSLFVRRSSCRLPKHSNPFHRVTDDSSLMAEADFREMKRALCGVIDFFFKTEPDLRTRLSESISHANEFAFRDRLIALLQRVSSEGTSRLIGDREEFIVTLRDTRNFYTHPGIKRRSTVLSEPVQLFKFDQKALRATAAAGAASYRFRRRRSLRTSCEAGTPDQRAVSACQLISTDASCRSWQHCDTVGSVNFLQLSVVGHAASDV